MTTYKKCDSCEGKGWVIDDSEPPEYESEHDNDYFDCPHCGTAILGKYVPMKGDGGIFCPSCKKRIVMSIVRWKKR